MATPAEGKVKEIEGLAAAETSSPYETKIASKYQEYQILNKIKDSIETDLTNKIRSMLQPIIQKQSKDAERQLELINQLQSQIKQLQKEVSKIHKSVSAIQRHRKFCTL
jgi:archaellum component FlaC